MGKKKHGKTLRKLIVEHNLQVIAEVGVYKGALSDMIFWWDDSREIVKQWWGIDAWDEEAHYHVTDWHGHTQAHWDWFHALSCQKLVDHPQYRVIRLPSVEAAKLFPDEFFDFVYIDADHNYEPVMQDIESWYPLVKKGGIIGGHDFGRWGVKPAVEDSFGHDYVYIDLGNVWLHFKK
jgi:hypothetical protein